MPSSLRNFLKVMLLLILLYVNEKWIVLPWTDLYDLAMETVPAAGGGGYRAACLSRRGSETSCGDGLPLSREKPFSGGHVPEGGEEKRLPCKKRQQRSLFGGEGQGADSGIRRGEHGLAAG